MDEIKAYNIKDLAKKEKCTPPTIYKYMDKYIAVQFKNGRAKRWVKEGTQGHPYSVRYIRVEDVKKILKKLDSTKKKNDNNNKSN